MENIIKRYSEKIGRNANSLIYLYRGKIINQKLSFDEVINLEDRNEMNILVQLKDSDKNIIKGLIDINLGDINNNIILFNTDIKNGINVYINKEAIYILRDNNKYKYNFRKEGKFLFEIVFDNIMTNMNSFFRDCSNTISLDLSNFDTSNIISMEGMFANCNKLKEIKGMKTFITKKVKNMNVMFQGCHELEYLDLSNFNTAEVINMECMFNLCYKLKKIKGINSFKINKVNNIKGMFQECYELEYLDLSNFDTSNITSMEFIFNKCKKLKEIKGINKFNTKKVKDMKAIFQECEELEYLDLSNFDTSNNTHMGCMFFGCKKLKKIKGINQFNTSKVNNMDAMFYQCSELEYLDLSNFETSNVTTMQFIFKGCLKLKEIKGIKALITKTVNNIKAMFQLCSELQNLDLSDFDTSNVTNMQDMFNGCMRLKEIKGINKFKTNKVNNMKQMFKKCCKLEYLD